MPAVYVNHGGGPMPLLGQQPSIARFLASYGTKFETKPRAILVVTAHWEEATITVSAGKSASLYFDYSGFPKESYHYTYPAPTAPDVSEEVMQLLTEAGIPVKTDRSRGWDHGVFVPMMLMFPKAEVPIVQMSVRRDQDSKFHIELGRALQPLRERQVLIVGSGVPFHNFGYFFGDVRTKEVGKRHSRLFDDWIRSVLLDKSKSPEERLKALADWESAPSARECHPKGKGEHFIPLLVIAGAGGGGVGRPVGEATETDQYDIMDFVMTQWEFS